ncbi:MAG: MATE family efflux transporter [Eubacteriales bacterium]|nr:MATE family efflux transporter [Eubacteriales bacterium]
MTVAQNKFKERDLTKGNVTKSIWLFALPLIFGNMLQQLYNIADTLIVGRYIGADALAAVGSSYTLMTLLNSIIMGLCMGSGVMFSMLYGAGEQEELKKSFVQSLVFTGLFAIVVEALSAFFLDALTVFMNIPESIVDETKAYLSIIFLGIIFTFIYNFLASILRAIGNSLIPLIFLMFSAGFNIILDIVFVLYLKMGIEGAAIATVAAQFFSALALLIYIAKKIPDILPQKRHFHIELVIMKKIISFSMLTCIQQSVMNFGILMIQGLVNSYGVAVMATFAAAVKIDSFAYMPVQDFGNAFSTFIAQNKGAGKMDRVKEGLKSAIISASTFCAVTSLIIFVFAKQLMTIFIDSNEIEIINIGIEYLHIEGACYIGIGCLFLFYGLYRGLGKAGYSIVLTILSLGTRVVLAYALSPIFGITAIWWSIPIGWFLADFAGFVALKFVAGINLDKKISM